MKYVAFLCSKVTGVSFHAITRCLAALAYIDACQIHDFVPCSDVTCPVTYLTDYPGSDVIVSKQREAYISYLKNISYHSATSQKVANSGGSCRGRRPRADACTAPWSGTATTSRAATRCTWSTWVDWYLYWRAEGRAKSDRSLSYSILKLKVILCDIFYAFVWLSIFAARWKAQSTPLRKNG